MRGSALTTVSTRALIIGAAWGMASGTASAQQQTGQRIDPGSREQTTTTDQAISAPLGASPGEQAAQEQTPDARPGDSEDIVVTGFRASLQNALNQKRQSNQIIDAITAEDIADFPDANIAESIQRLPGVSIDRDNGEGRTITVRGLGGDFQSVFLNGADAQSVAGGSSAGAVANRSRGFDFNTFASELFGGITITKSTAASNDEGSLGAIIDLITGRPLSYDKDRISLGAEGEYRENGKTFNPRLTGLFSKRLTDRFGILGTIAYQRQRQQIDAYNRSIGQYEYVYRGNQLNGITPPTFGFALPAGTGTGPIYGSDAGAYAKLSPLTIFPALPSVGRQDLAYRRIGATLSAQWQPTERSEMIADFVYSRYEQDSTSTGLTTVGLNRNSTNARATILTGANGLRAPNTANGLADRVALYSRCIPGATADCGQSIYGGRLVPGTRDSFNPRNLNPFDYYNSPVSPGYTADPNQIAGYAALIGRPATKVRDANVNADGQADYLRLDDVDWRSSADAQFGVTDFWQGTLNFKQDVTDRLQFVSTVGYSQSKYNSTSLLAEFNTLDRDGYVFDERAGGKMPAFNPGFDVSDPNNWSLVKGLSSIRAYTSFVENQFRVVRTNFAWEMGQELTLRFGGTFKRFNFAADQSRTNQDLEPINPTLAEAGLRITDLGRVVGFGQGLDLPQGTPTSFYAPDLNAFRQAFGIDCNCVNQWRDFRAIRDGRQRSEVQERDLSGFAQLDFDVRLLGRPLRGNAGLRIANTKVVGRGNVGGTDGVAGTPVSGTNEYTDYLPATNLNWEITDSFIARFAAARVISRPQLANLTPGTTSFPTGLNATNAPTLTVGNPYLNPFRATNWDLSFERYFGRSGLIGVAFFIKDIESFPQQIATEAPLSAVFQGSTYDQVLASITSVALLDYTRAGGVFGVRQFADAPGGTVKGVEVNVQANFTFLPAPLNNMGVTANYTHIESKLNYLTGTSLSTRRDGTSPSPSNTFVTGPFLNTSPDSFNATLYYEDAKFSARVSGAYRTRYVNRFPLVPGSCSVGLTTNSGAACNSPIIADFGYVEDTLNVDAALSYALTSFARLTLEGRNLTNVPQYRTMYAANPVSQLYGSTGRIITGGMRLTF